MDKSDRFKPPTRTALVALALCGVICGVIFGVLTAAVLLGNGVLASVDTRGLDGVVATRCPWLTDLAKLVTLLGTGPVVYGLLVLVGLVLWRRAGTWVPAVVALGALVAGQAVRMAVNDAVHRARPPESGWLSHPGGYSYPSGHTTTAVIGYGLIAALAIRLAPRHRTALLVAAGAVAAAVGLSRIYLGVHWPSDVVGGLAFGAAWLALVALLALAVQRWRGEPLREGADRGSADSADQ